MNTCRTSLLRCFEERQNIHGLDSMPGQHFLWYHTHRSPAPHHTIRSSTSPRIPCAPCGWADTSSLASPRNACTASIHSSSRSHRSQKSVFPDNPGHRYGLPEIKIRNADHERVVISFCIDPVKTHSASFHKSFQKIQFIIHVNIATFRESACISTARTIHQSVPSFCVSCSLLRSCLNAY